MHTIDLLVGGLMITWDGESRSTAMLTSDLKDSCSDAQSPYNLAVEGVEQFILNQFILGVDVRSEVYQASIKQTIDRLYESLF